MVKRVNYFDGQFLRAKDFNDEQAYETGMRQKHNSLLHTWGVADGLVPSADQNATVVTVGPGFAIDIQGREIELDVAAQSPALTNMAGKTAYVTIAWSETPSDLTTEAGASGATRVELTPIVGLSQTPNSGVELILGKVTVNAQGGVVSVDATTSDRRLAGVKSGDLTATSLTLTGLGIDPSLQPHLGVSKPGQIDLQGSLAISKSLGVGTASPQATLDIGGNSANNVQAILARGADAGFELYVANGPGNNPGDLQAKFGLRYGTGDAATLSFIRGGAGQDGSIAFSTLALERMRIDSAGRVGIGAASPAAQLDIGGVAPNNVQAILARGQSPDFQLYAANGASNNPGTTQATFGLRYTGPGGGDSATLAFVRGNSGTDASIVFNTQGAERLRIDSAGNLKSSKWRVTQLLNQRQGPLPLQVGFLAGGGTLLILFSGSGRAGQAGTIGMQLQIDNVIETTSSVCTNEPDAHQVFSPNAFVRTNLAAGNRVASLVALPGTVTDLNDYFNITVLELPF